MKLWFLVGKKRLTAAGTRKTNNAKCRPTPEPCPNDSEGVESDSGVFDTEQFDCDSNSYNCGETSNKADARNKMPAPILDPLLWIFHRFKSPNSYSPDPPDCTIEITVESIFSITN
ncbi:MAG: hypothetical protein KJ795_03690 [Gammaproteobacteria bacterium]|nr:hypothetical protein [Gammaproteobacteria bacterium]MBU1777653.1 hypothetical protein [Gammaproteobacteria bacterium]MBU1967874.1 hypothetical protein [Gammaproteobacteria bacterium]